MHTLILYKNEHQLEYNTRVMFFKNAPRYESHFSFLRCINHEKGERSKEKLGLPKGTALQFHYFFIIGAAIEFPANFAARHLKVDGGRLTTNSKVAYFCLSMCVSTCSLLESVRCSTRFSGGGRYIRLGGL